MVRQINIFLDDEEHEKIIKIKADMTWIAFMRLAAELIEKDKKKK